MDVFLDNIKNVSFIVLFAYPLTWYDGIQRSVSMIPASMDKIVMVFMFGVLGIIANVGGTVVFNDAIINSGIIASVVAGIIGGPAVGILSGLIIATHRLAMGGFTVMPDCLALILGGLAGINKFGGFYFNRVTFVWSFSAGVIASSVNILLIFIMAEPRILATAFIKWIGVSSMLASGLGAGLFIGILTNVRRQKNSIGANYAEKATEIAQKSLAVIKGNPNSAVVNDLVSILNDAALADAVAISDGQRILAFAGRGSEIHILGCPDLEIARSIADDRKTVVANSKGEIKCSIPHCPHDAVIIAPLQYSSDTMWYLHAYKVNNVFHQPDISLITGIASLLSLQMQNSRLEEQAKLLAHAEYVALRSQVNPHFLFNTLSAIKLQIRQNPAKAQNLILALASFFRRTLEHKEELIPLSEEIKCVEFYMTIQQARYGDRLKVEYEIDPECMSFLLPSFVVQPLVENCFNHGFADKRDSMVVKIRASLNCHLFSVIIEDNGSGIPQDVIDAVKSNKIIQKLGVGLTNVNRRLKSIYGQRCSFTITDTHPGSIVQISIEREGNP